MTHDTRDVDEWEKEFDELFEYEPEGCSECLGYSLKDRTQIPYPQGTYHQEYDLEKIKAFFHHQLQKAREEEREKVVNAFYEIAVDQSVVNTGQRLTLINQMIQAMRTINHSELDQDVSK